MGLQIKHIFKNIDYRRIFYHILFWVTMNLIWDLLSSYLKGRPFSFEFILNDLIYFTPFQVFTVYVTLYYLFPKYLYKKKYYHFTLFFILFFVGTIVLLALPLNYSGYKDYMLQLKKEADIYSFFKHYFVRMANLNLMIVGLAGTIKLLRKWLKTQKRQRILEKETLEMKLKLQESEIKLIKSQINPNFLFDSLSTLHILTKEKSALAPEMVLKVSSLLDYMLYDSNSKWVEVYKEIENVKNYIDLKKANPKNSSQILFDVQGDFENVKVKPSIFLPAVENVFKYANHSQLMIAQYYIKITLVGDRLKLVVQGSTDKQVDISKIEEIYTPIQSVLDLQYPKLYVLGITQKMNVLQVSLDIQINHYENKMSNN